MNFEETIRWLYSFQKFGVKLGLERIIHIVEKLGNPQNSYKIIHVGGTNGKGSVCKFLESILVKNGYNVGVYTSPHLQRITERITINNKEISEEELILLVEKIKPIIEEMMEIENNATFFEVFTAITFEYFREKKVDFAVIEVGLGGRFDATNIVNPLVSVITNVSSEHQNILGKKVEDIAFEKAGIIKENVPIVTAAKDDALNVIENISKEKKANLNIITNSSWERTKIDDSGQNFLINGFLDNYSVQTTMKGKYQGENIALAIGVVELLKNQSFKIFKNNLIDGVRKTINPGRMEVAGYNPCILLDGAHNIEGIKYLAETLKNDFKFERLILVLGILSDKNIKEMLPQIIPNMDIVITTKSSNDRAFDPFDLKEIIEQLGYGKELIAKNRIDDAINYAKSIANSDDLICITGSLFTVGEAKDYLFSKLQKC